MRNTRYFPSCGVKVKLIIRVGTLQRVAGCIVIKRKKITRGISPRKKKPFVVRVATTNLQNDNSIIKEIIGNLPVSFNTQLHCWRCTPDEGLVVGCSWSRTRNDF
jgi:hypothetical protein